MPYQKILPLSAIGWLILALTLLALVPVFWDR